MPVTCGHKDSKGTYCIWGGHGAHYYYTPGDKASMERARKKAEAQGAAAHAHGYKGSEGEVNMELIENEVPHKSGSTNPNEDEPGYEENPGEEGDYNPQGGRDPYSGEGVGGQMSKETLDNVSQSLDNISAWLEKLKKCLP